jgi:hypothetical protein
MLRKVIFHLWFATIRVYNPFRIWQVKLVCLSSWLDDAVSSRVAWMSCVVFVSPTAFELYGRQMTSFSVK